MSGPAKKIGIAIIGLGRMGAIHARSVLLSPRAKVSWVVRRDLDAAQAFATSYDPSVKCAGPGDLDKVLADKSVDAVVICSPTSEHEPVIRAAIDAGKAVLSEKPITADLSSTQALYEKAEARDVPLMCAFHRRFDPSLLSVKTGLESRSSGRLRLLRSSSHDPNPPTPEYVKSSGGIFKDSTIHDLDVALWMASSPARNIYVKGHAFDPDIRSAGDLDLVVLSIEHESGSVSVIDNGRRCAHGYDQRLEALCDNGSFVVSNRGVNQMVQHSITSSTNPPIDQVFDTRYPEAYSNEMEHFLDVVQGKASLRVTKEDTLAAMRLAEAATESAKTGKVVHL